MDKNQIVVLLVDDQKIIVEAIKRMLADEKDISFQFCNEGNLALQKAIECSPTVILQDLVMPEVDGMSLLRSYQNDPATRKIPIVVLSSKEDPAIKQQALSNGAADYMVKLPKKDDLILKIRFHSENFIKECKT